MALDTDKNTTVQICICTHNLIEVFYLWDKSCWKITPKANLKCLENVCLVKFLAYHQARTTRLEN